MLEFGNARVVLIYRIIDRAAGLEKFGVLYFKRKIERPMPFFMQADKAAKIIAKGLSKNKGRITFPFPLAFASVAKINSSVVNFIRKFYTKYT